MKKFYIITAVHLAFIFNFFNIGYTHEGEKKALLLDMVEEPLQHIYSYALDESEDLYVKAEEGYKLSIRRSDESRKTDFNSADNYFITQQILRNSSSEEQKNFEFLYDILLDQTSLQRKYRQLRFNYSVDDRQRLTINLQVLGAEISSIDSALKNSSQAQEQIATTRQTAVNSFIKSFIPLLKKVRKKAKFLENPEETRQFTTNLSALIEQADAFPDYLKYIDRLQNLLVHTQIVPLLSSSKTSMANKMVKTLRLFFKILRNEHFLQDHHAELRVGTPHHSWFTIVVGWECLLTRLEEQKNNFKSDEDAQERDECLEKEMYATIQLHQKKLEKMLKYLQDISIQSEGVQELLNDLTEITDKFNVYAPCQNCKRSAFARASMQDRAFVRITELLKKRKF